MRLFIEPCDVWLFRDGRPFDAGSDHRAASLFPPPPTVLQGAIRAAHVRFRGVSMDDYARGNVAQLNAEIGNPGDPPPFIMRGPFIATRENGAVTRWLPIPADAARAPGGFRSLTPIARDAYHLQTNLPDELKWLLWQSDADREPVGAETEAQNEKEFAWAMEAAIRAYLGADKRDQRIAYADARADDDLFERENRFGVGLDYDARRYVESALYEAEFIRAQVGIGLDVQVDGLDVQVGKPGGWSAAGLLKLGGEGRMAHFEALPDEKPVQTALPARFKVYLATPALFKDGWRAGDWNEFFTKPVKLVAAALARYQARGGFDLVNQDHKPSQRYVPAGSVYYFESTDGVELKKNNVTDEDANLGFGQVLTGGWYV